MRISLTRSNAEALKQEATRLDLSPSKVVNDLLTQLYNTPATRGDNATRTEQKL